MDGAVLKLTDELFAQDALCFLDPASRSLRFVEPSGAAIELTLGGFCACRAVDAAGRAVPLPRSMDGYSDPEGFTGELKDKPGMRMLAGRRDGAP